MLGELVERRLHLGADGVIVDRGWAAHDIPLHVAAGGERGHLDVVDPLHEGLQVALHHAVVLDRLPRGEPDRAVAHLIAEIDRREQLVGRQLAARHARPDHERDLASAFGAFLGLPLLTVVLLVGAVVLEQLDTRLAESRGPVDEFLGNVSG